MVSRQNVVVVAGVPNGGPMANLLGNAYNVIAVGTHNGLSSYGPTTIDGTGRCKPDLVAPGSDGDNPAETSWATARSFRRGRFALADRRHAIGRHPRSRSSSSMLIAPQLPRNNLPGWSHSQTQPLDLTYGAGQLNIANSYQILAAGQIKPSNTPLVSSTGWDYNSIAAGGNNIYYFSVPQGQSVDFSALLNWNQHLDSLA